jgi:hypothetical protein
MKGEAEALTKWATEAYNSLRTQYPHLSEREVFGKMLDQRGKFGAGETIRTKFLDRYGTSLHGFCYFLGLNTQPMKGMMVSRCVQFTQYVDIELEKRGVTKPSDDIRRGYFQTLGLPDNAITENYL